MTSHRLYPDANWFTTPTAVSVAYNKYFGELSTRQQRPSRQRRTFSGMLRGLAAWIAAIREREVVLTQLSGMSDRDLADIGLNRGQMHAVFDPEFMHERDAAHRAAACLQVPRNRI